MFIFTCGPPFFFGGWLAAAPIVATLLTPGAPPTRHIIAVSQACWSALLIHLMGGRIETHFHVFGSLAFLALYRDWRVLITATLVVTVDHYVRGTWWPMSVYGVGVEAPYRWLEHAAWVAFEDVVLVIACLRSNEQTMDVCHRQAELELMNDEVEERIQLRTHELADAQQFAESVLDSVQDSICILDSDGAIVAGNARWNAFAEDTAVDSANFSVGECYFTALENAAQNTEHVALGIRAVMNRRTRQFVAECAMTVRGADGSAQQRWCQLRVTPMEAGSRGSVVVTHSDVTQRVHDEEERERLHREVQQSARQAGMAEVATGVLHNVGNVLNSVNVSAGLIQERVATSRVEVLVKVAALLAEQEDIADFLRHDPRGRAFPDLFNELSAALSRERSEELQELEALQEKHSAHQVRCWNAAVVCFPSRHSRAAEAQRCDGRCAHVERHDARASRSGVEQGVRHDISHLCRKARRRTDSRQPDSKRIPVLS